MSRRLTLPSSERRRLSLGEAGLAIRAAEDDDAAPKFWGYAAKFNERTEIGNPMSWGFFEEIASTAFTKTLQEGDQRFLVDHLSNLVVSRVSAGTLRLSTDKVGLITDSDLNEKKSYVNDLIENLRDGSITGMSFGFQTVKDSWQTIDVELANGKTIEAELRIVQEAKLWEVSAVTFPAYDVTEAQLRSVATALVRSGDMDRLARHAEREPDLMRFVPEPSDITRAADQEEPAASTPEVDAKALAEVKRFMDSRATWLGLPRR